MDIAVEVDVAHLLSFLRPASHVRAVRVVNDAHFLGASPTLSRSHALSGFFLVSGLPYSLDKQSRSRGGSGWP